MYKSEYTLFEKNVNSQIFDNISIEMYIYTSSLLGGITLHRKKSRQNIQAGFIYDFKNQKGDNVPIIIKFYFSGYDRNRNMRRYKFHAFMEVSPEHSIKDIKNYIDLIAERECKECNLICMEKEKKAISFRICNNPQDYKGKIINRFS